MQLSTVVRDMFLVEFYDKKYSDDSQLINFEDLFRCVRTNFNIVSDVFCRYTNELRCRIKDTFEKDIFTNLESNYTFVLDILNIGKGKISLVGINIFTMIGDNGPFDFIFAFDSCTEDEVNLLLSNCLKLLENYAHFNITDEAIYFKYKNIAFGCFLFTAYPNKITMLRNIGPSGDRHGWNPITGYFGTVSAVATYYLSLFPIEPEFRTIGMNRYEGNGIGIILHGINDIDNYEIVTSDGKITFEYDIKIYFDTPVNDIYSSLNYCAKSVTFLVNINPKIKVYDNSKSSINIKDWLRGKYKLYTVGIDNDRYVAFSNCRRKFNISNDIFSLLCLHWLTVETIDAKQRLLHN